MFVLLQTSLDEATDRWGIKVERVDMLVNFFIYITMNNICIAHSMSYTVICCLNGFLVIIISRYYYAY